MAQESLDARISPSLTVNDMRRSLQFYTDGLGFEIARQTEREGKLQFAALKAGSGQLSIGQDDFAKGRDRLKGVGMRIFISTTQDVTAIANRAKAAGIALDSDPAPLPWGPLAFAVTDPDGFKLTIANER